MLAEVKLGGAAPLYSAHLGHLRLVSVHNISINMRGLGDRRPEHTHVTNLAAMSTPALQHKEMVSIRDKGAREMCLQLCRLSLPCLFASGFPPL